MNLGFHKSKVYIHVIAGGLVSPVADYGFVCDVAPSFKELGLAIGEDSLKLNP